MALTVSEYAMSDHPVATIKPAAGPPPRKRRRRATAAGANDDCFACQKLSMRCDRKRPYCTQCIEFGKECSGYKTTLTWGVGVASRGKLRGLSCPIANKNIDGTDASPAEMESRRRKSSATSRVKKEEFARSSSSSTNTVLYTPTSQPAMQRGNARSYSASSATIPSPVFRPEAQWHLSGFQEHLQSRHFNHVKPRSFQHPSLPRLPSALASQGAGYVALDTAGSVSSFGDTEFHSPTEYPVTPGSIGYPDHMLSMAANVVPGHAKADIATNSYTLSESAIDPYMDSMSSDLEVVMSATSLPLEISGGRNSQASNDTLQNMMFESNNGLSYDDLDYLVNGEVDNHQKHLIEPDARFSSPFFHLAPRMQSLMDYYDQTICPYLVAFDGAHNPYRMHILQLAMHNPGLQHAIAALATNNLRMRRKGPKHIGFVTEITDAFDPASDDASEPSPEESMYKQLSIDQLNAQLTYPRAAQDDSVLATLLILCLFHVCDSGFSKFKVQLAGMQKLLALRNTDVHSDFTGWVKMFFMWFDVMTSTVNDREVQIKHESLDMPNFSTDLGALEQFSGCDGPLFKLISRLGRLNLLAQGRQVQSQDGDRAQFPAVACKPLDKSTLQTLSQQRMRYQPSTTPEFEHDEGHIWRSNEEPFDGSHPWSHVDPHHLDGRQEFWFEWHDIRSRLQSWTMSPQITSSCDHGSGRKDLIHINESFRLSALLYTERLGYPLLPSSHHQYQSLVSQALYHITSLDILSCVNKFLLWPLFIIGTECVDEGHRNIIRARCVEVQKESGFYNNISTLHVLERVWSEAGSNVAGFESAEIHARRRDSETAEDGKHGQAFRWRKAMDRVDGEYLVI
nr:hypothetical protein CFP56_69353 [Quercus suber]